MDAQLQVVETKEVGVGSGEGQRHAGTTARASGVITLCAAGGAYHPGSSEAVAVCGQFVLRIRSVRKTIRTPAAAVGVADATAAGRVSERTTSTTCIIVYIGG